MNQFYVVAIQSYFAKALFLKSAKQIRSAFTFLLEKEGFDDFTKLNVQSVPFIQNIGKLSLNTSAAPFNARLIESSDSNALIDSTSYWSNANFGFADDEFTDISTSHIPLSVDNNCKIRLQKDSIARIRSMLDDSPFTYNVKMHIHIYPYGVVNILFTIAIHTMNDVAAEKISDIISFLVNTNSYTQGAQYAIGGQIPVTLFSLFDFVAKHIANSIYKERTKAGMTRMGFFRAAHIGDADMRITDDAAYIFISRLAGEREPERLKINVGAGTSIFGKYRNDHILVNANAFLFVTKPDSEQLHLKIIREDHALLATLLMNEHGESELFKAFEAQNNRRSADRKFFWRLLTVIELGINQKIIYEYTKTLVRDAIALTSEMKSMKVRLKNYTKARIFDEHILTLLMNLLSTHENLYPKYRKWYHVMSGYTGVQKRAAELSVLVQEILQLEENWEMPLFKDIKAIRDLLPF